MEVALQIMSVFITGGGIIMYLRKLDRQLDTLQTITIAIPKEYVLKKDCHEDMTYLRDRINSGGPA